MKPATSNLRLSTLTVLAATLVPLAGHSQGQVTYIPLGTATGNNALTQNSSFFTYVAFTTGNNAPGYTFDSLALQFAASSGTPLGGIFVYVEANDNMNDDGGGALGGDNTYLDGIAQPIAAGTYTYTPYSGAGFTLAADTTYWLLVKAGNPVAAYEWSYASAAPPTTGGWSIGSVSNGLGEPDQDITGTPLFSITATPIAPVPEPGTFALAGLGGLACAALRLCRK